MQRMAQGVCNYLWAHGLLGREHADERTHPDILEKKMATALLVTNQGALTQHRDRSRIGQPTCCPINPSPPPAHLQLLVESWRPKQQMLYMHFSAFANFHISADTAS